jgi:hypothetical protein
VRLSSGAGHYGLVAGVVSLHSPQDVEAPPCQAQDRLGMAFALRALAVVRVS